MASKGKNSRRRNTASRGFVNNTILECLLDGDKYGYEIIKEVKDKTDGKVVLKEPSLYSSLKRFEQKGYITSYWGDSDIGGRRHYYRLTEPGKNYYNSIKSPAPIDLNDIEDDLDSTEVQQMSLENINDAIYNIENDEIDVDDAEYFNNVSYNVEDKLNQLLEDDNPPTVLTETNDIPNNLFEEQSNNDNLDSLNSQEEKELIEEINSAIHNDEIENSNDIENSQNEQTSSPTLTSSDPEYEDYMYEHKFRKESTTEITNGSEKFVQYDLFNNNQNVNNYVDAKEETPIETTSKVEKQQLSANTTEKEIEKEIPLIQESEVSFFNWNEMKRQASNNKTSFSNNASKINSPTNKYDLNYSHDEKINTYENNDFKTKTDLHNLFDTTKSNSNENKIINNISPSKVNNKIFDNVKDRIELNDAVIGNKKEEYNDEPVMTEADYELLNKKINEKFDNFTENKTVSKRNLDYKKILGDLYYNDTKGSEEYEEYTEHNNTESEINYDVSNNDVNYGTNSYEELIDNNIEDEKIYNAINKSKKYSYNTLKESLSNDGFKFKPYSIDVEEDEAEHFVKINKVRFVYGAIMALIMLLQIAVVYIILKSNNNIYSHDIVLYVIAIIACVATFIAYLIPYITRKDERKSKYYNLNYHLMFGVLYLFCGLILTYAINLIMGLNNANIASFVSRLLLPAILLTNFVISPIIYKLVMDSKNIK